MLSEKVKTCTYTGLVKLSFPLGNFPTQIDFFSQQLACEQEP
jgi:hypothetical protein